MVTCGQNLVLAFAIVSRVLFLRQGDLAWFIVTSSGQS